MKYLHIQFKKLLRLLPTMLVISLLTIVSLGVIAFLVKRNLEVSDGDRSKVGVGIVGDIDSSYMSFGIHILNTMDSSGVSVRFLSIGEDDAREKLQSGEIIGYFHISSDFIEGLSKGENGNIQFVSSPSSGALMYTLGKEVASTLTDLLLHSELAVYAMENYYTDNPSLGDVYQANEELNKKLIFGVLGRKKIYDVNLLDSFEEIEVVDYYIGAMLCFYLLLSGLGMSVMFVSKDRDLLKLLYSRNIHSIQQIACEYLMTILTNLFGVIMILTIFFLASDFIFLNGFQLNYTMTNFIINIIMATVMISSLQFFLFELMDEIVPAMLVQFILGLALAFASGILYPLSFFPKSMQELAVFLPSRQAMLLIYEGMGYPITVHNRYILICSVIPIVLAILLRYRLVKR